MLSHRTIQLLCMCLVFTSSPSVAMGGLPHLASWKIVSEDEQYVFVMVSPLSVEEDAGHPSFDSNEIRYIRATYPESGLYHNDGTATLLWAMPYHDWTHEVFIGPNGNHVVLAHDDWYNIHDHIVSFYSNGNQLASYCKNDLVSENLLKSLLTGVEVDGGGMAYNSNALTFSSRTNQGEAFVFDTTTGKMIRHISPFPNYTMMILLSIAICLLFLIHLMHRHSKALPGL